MSFPKKNYGDKQRDSKNKLDDEFDMFNSMIDDKIFETGNTIEEEDNLKYGLTRLTKDLCDTSISASSLKAYSSFEDHLKEVDIKEEFNKVLQERMYNEMYSTIKIPEELMSTQLDNASTLSVMPKSINTKSAVATHSAITSAKINTANIIANSTVGASTVGNINQGGWTTTPSIGGNQGTMGINQNGIYFNSGGGIRIMNHIQHVNIHLAKQDLVDTLDNYYSAYSNNGNSYKLNELKTRQGKIILEFIEDDTSSKMLMNYDKAKNEVHICKFKFASRDFITGFNNIIDSILLDLSHKFKGDYVAVQNDKMTVVINGLNKDADFVILEKDSKMFLDKEYMNIDGDGVTTVKGFKIKKTIGEFLIEQPDIKLACKGMAIPDGLNSIAKTLMQMKVSGKIDYDEFLDLFRQCAIMGATDPNVLKFYQLLKL